MKLQPMHNRIIDAIQNKINDFAGILEAANIKERTLIKALDDMEKAGYIEQKDNAYYLVEPKEPEQIDESKICVANIRFDTGQNATHLTKVFEHFGYKVNLALVRTLEVFPPSGLCEAQILDDIESILNGFTNKYSVIVKNAPNFNANGKPEHLSKLDIKNAVVGLKFEFHMQVYQIVKVLSKRRKPHDLITMPADTEVEFVTIDEDDNLHSFSISTQRKAMPFKLFRGSLNMTNFKNI